MISIKITILVFSLIITCNSLEKLENSPDRVYADSSNVKFKGIEELELYLYEFYQEKCPGTTISDNEDKCIRSVSIVEENRIQDFASVTFKDSVYLDPEAYFVADFPRFERLVPSGVFGKKLIREYFPDNASYQNSRFYSSRMVKELKSESSKCTISSFNQIRITECKIGVQNSLVFNVSRDLLEFVSSPLNGLETMGMPLIINADSSQLIWLVPKDSPILYNLPSYSPSM